LTRDHRLEALEKGQSFGRRQRGLVFDRVRDAAQQIGIGHRHPQRRRQLGNRQRKGARYVRKDLVLIPFVRIAGIHASSISESQRRGTFGRVWRKVPNPF
jgi:hypothetical protein